MNILTVICTAIYGIMILFSICTLYLFTTVNAFQPYFVDINILVSIYICHVLYSAVGLNCHKSKYRKIRETRYGSVAQSF